MKPFLKWAGGKTQLLPEITTRLPQTYRRYFEPFLGGGAVFFSLEKHDAVISDSNSELINTYQVVRDDVENLITNLKLFECFSPEFYITIRNWDRSSDFCLRPPLERACRFIYLNKTCFNGMWRVNSKGQFNTSKGTKSKPPLIDEDNLRLCSQLLKSSEIYYQSYNYIEPIRNDFVYLDPPYIPLTESSNFTSYTMENFNMTNQIELANFCKDLHQKGVYFMLSNSYNAKTFELYHDFKIDTVSARRNINGDGTKRGEIKELLITNY